MSDAGGAPAPGIRVPRGALWGALGLISFTFAAIAFGREQGVGLLETPPVEPAQSRELIFLDRPDRGMDVLGSDGNPITTLAIVGDTFEMTAVRALAMHRSEDVTATGYRLRLRRDARGRLDLADPRTGRKVPLAGFGPDNIGVFEAYFGQAGPRG